RRGAEHLGEALEQNGISAAALSGDVPQRKRLKMLRDFQAGELPVLIATDVASRGLHVPDVSHVFNYDLPQDAEDYVHRVGRTARAGASGDAISFGCEDYVVSLPDIEEYIGRKIDVGTYDHEKLVKVSVPPRPRRSERRDGRPGDRDARSGSGRRGPPSGRRRDRNGRRPDADERASSGRGAASDGTGEAEQHAANANGASPPEPAAAAHHGPERTGDGESPSPKRRRRRRGRRGAGAAAASEGAASDDAGKTRE